MILKDDFKFDYDADFAESFTSAMNDIISSGYKYIYKDEGLIQLRYTEEYNKYTGQKEFKRLKTSGLYLSKAGNENMEITEFKIVLSALPIEQIADSEADNGYIPISSYTQSERSFDVVGKSPMTYTNYPNYNGLLYTSGTAVNYLNAVLMVKRGAGKSKKSGWALVKYEEVDAPE